MDEAIYWRAKAGKKDLAGADLSHADLRDVKLRDADLTGADLHGANLNRADLRRTDLHNANLADTTLHDAILYRANLHDADLHDADLHKADLQVADFQDADLHGADLSGAILLGARFAGADLSGAKVTEKQVQGGHFAGYRFSDGRLIADGEIAGEDAIATLASPALAPIDDGAVTDLVEPAPPVDRPAPGAVEASLAANALPLAQLADALSHHAELASLEIDATRPNSDDRIALKETKLALLNAIAASARVVADTLRDLDGPMPVDRLQGAAEKVAALAGAVDTWFAESGGEARQWANDHPVVAGVRGFLSLAGFRL